MPPCDFKMRPWQGVLGASRPAQGHELGQLPGPHSLWQGAPCMMSTEIPS